MAEQDSEKGLNWEKAVFYAEEGKPKQAEKLLRVSNIDDEEYFSLMVSAYRNQERVYRDKADENARAGDIFSTRYFLDKTHLEPESAFKFLITAYRQTRKKYMKEGVWEDIELAAEEGAVFTAENLMEYYGLEGEVYFQKMIHAYRNRLDAKEKAEYMAEKGKVKETFDYLDGTEIDDWEALNILIKAHRHRQG